MRTVQSQLLLLALIICLGESNRRGFGLRHGRRRRTAARQDSSSSSSSRSGSSGSIIAGQGDYQYRYVPLLDDDDQHDGNIVIPGWDPDQHVQDGHGITVNRRNGDIYYTFNPKRPVPNDTAQAEEQEVNHDRNHDYHPDTTNATTSPCVLIRFRMSKNTTHDHLENTTSSLPPAPRIQATLLPHDPLLAEGVPHGLEWDSDDNVDRPPVGSNLGYLYHANNQQRVTKTNLHGHILWTTDFSSWQTERPEYWPILPTDVVRVPQTDLLLVADGYGSSFIHTLNATTGEYLEGRSFGGTGSTLQPLRFSTPHNIDLDHASLAAPDEKREALFIVTDRSNQRLVWINARGDVKRVETQLDVHGAPLPCSVDNSFTVMTAITLNTTGTATNTTASDDRRDVSSLARKMRRRMTTSPKMARITTTASNRRHQRLWAVPSLGHDWSGLVQGKVALYLSDDDQQAQQDSFAHASFNQDHNVSSSLQLVSTLDIADLLGHKGFQHPHDVIVVPGSGDVIVCTWSGPNETAAYGAASRGTISYWQRITLPNREAMEEAHVW